MKFNRYISILLSSLILVSNIGLALNVHYCKGQVSSVSLAYKLEEPCNDHHDQELKSCCTAKGDSHKSCCDNNLVKLQDESDGKVIVKSLQLDLASFYVPSEFKPSVFYSPEPVVSGRESSFYCEANAPPLFKLYCRYILYA